MDIKTLLSNPVWNGIQGAITILTFLFLLKEKKSELVPQLKKFLPVITEAARIFVLIFWGWFFTYFLFYTLLDLAVVVLNGLSTPPMDFRNYLADFLSFPPEYIKLTIPTSLAAMSTLDERTSRKRAIFVGNVTFTISYLYFGFFSKPFIFLKLFGLLDEIEGLRVSDYILFGSIIVLSAIIAVVVLAYITGVLSTKGVIFGRRFINKLGKMFNKPMTELTKPYLETLKKYLPK